jgi:hypothetical protein
MTTEGETLQVCPNLQVLDMSTPGDAADVNPIIKFLPHTLKHLSVDSSDCLHDRSSQQELDYRIGICRVTKGGHIEQL